MARRERVPIGALTSYGTLAVLWSCIAALIAHAISDAIPLSTAFVAMTLLGVWLVDRVSPPDCAWRARAFAAIASCGLSPALLALAGLALAETTLYSPYYRCGLASMAYAIVAFFACTVGALVSTVVASFASRHFAGAGLAFRVLAGVVTAAAAIGVVIASGNALARPAPSSYVDSLPVVARFGEAAADDAADQTVMTESGAFVRGRSQDGCFIAKTPAARRPPPDGPGLCGALDVRYSPAANAYFFTAAADGSLVRLALTPGGDTTYVRARELAGAVSAPRGWLLLSWLGIATAIASLVHGARMRRSLRARARWKEGRLDEDGWVHFDDGAPPRHLPHAAALRKGPVLVDMREGPSAPYRADGASVAVEVIAMSAEELRDDAEERSVALSAFAIAAVVLACSPLAAAALAGVAF